MRIRENISGKSLEALVRTKKITKTRLVEFLLMDMAEKHLFDNKVYVFFRKGYYYVFPKHKVESNIHYITNATIEDIRNSILATLKQEQETYKEITND